MARALGQSIRSADDTSALSVIDVPVLVINRKDDPFAPVAWARELAGQIPAARLVLTEGSDHLPWFGEPEDIILAIARFLGQDHIDPLVSRRLMTVMFTDIVESTGMAVGLGDAAWTELLGQHNEILRDLIDSYSGEEVKTIGDGFLAVFMSSAKAVECGLMASSQVHELGLKIRAGAHTGELEVQPDDVLGLSVNVAARITALAGADEVLVSESLRDMCAGASLGFQDRGEYELKGVPGMWHLYSAWEEDLVIDLRQPKELTTGDHVSVFLARRAPAALRSLAGLAARRRP
jgi:class 3 adenylate cyclase